MVKCSDILQSTYKREDFSIHGVFPKILTRDERKKPTTEQKTKIQIDEEKLAKRKKEMEDAKEARLHQKALADKSKMSKLGGASRMGRVPGVDEKDLREQQREEEEQAKYDRDY